MVAAITGPQEWRGRMHRRDGGAAGTRVGASWMSGTGSDFGDEGDGFGFRHREEPGWG